MNAKEEKKIEANKGELLHLCRNKVVTNLFQEFHREAYTYEGLKYIIDFLVKISS